ncbi:hypothetical protein ACFWSJ_24730 [Streptomyces niveus]|uniref:hypothetical protein n=1 Tax=Streptomyces niveus TaxID=193462 RepID=UPI003653CECC
MHHADHPTDEVIAATGLTEDEITTLINTQERQFDAYEAAGVEELLRWAEQHHLAGVRGRAARIRCELADLTTRRDDETSTREAHQRVAKAKAELERATRAATASLPAGDGGVRVRRWAGWLLVAKHE